MNAGAVIAHPDQPNAALLHLDGDAGRAGIQAVFQQLLDYGGRTFDHLAGGDLTDQLRRQPLDARAHREENPAMGGEMAR